MTQWTAWRAERLRPVLLLLLAAATVACRIPAGIAPPVHSAWEERRQVLDALNEWSFIGSIRVRDGEESHSSRIRWEQQQERYRINLWGTFNAGATEIIGEPDRVTITRGGEKPVTTRSPERMVYRELGYELPVSHLDYWLKGIPVPDHPAQTQFGENDQLLELRQAGWHIRYLGYEAHHPETLPVRIRVERGPLRVDLVRMQWELPASGNGGTQ